MPTSLDHRSRLSLLIEVYRYFQEWMGDKNFVVMPTDSIYGIYGIVDEDLDEAVFELARRCNCKTPTSDDAKGVDPIRTVAELARFLNRLKQVAR